MRWHLATDTDFKTVDQRLSGRFGDWRGVCDVDGIPAKANAGSPTVLIAYGEEARVRLWKARHLGAFVGLR